MARSLSLDEVPDAWTTRECVGCVARRGLRQSWRFGCAVVGHSTRSKQRPRESVDGEDQLRARPLASRLRDGAARHIAGSVFSARLPRDDCVGQEQSRCRRRSSTPTHPRSSAGSMRVRRSSPDSSSGCRSAPGMRCRRTSLLSSRRTAIRMRRGIRPCDRRSLPMRRAIAAKPIVIGFDCSRSRWRTSTRASTSSTGTIASESSLRCSPESTRSFRIATIRRCAAT